MTELWDEWFNGQQELTGCVERAIGALSKGRNDQFKVALYAAVIESAAEAMRRYLDLDLA